MAANDYTYFTYSTPHGPLTLRASARGLVDVAFGQVEFDGRRVATAITNQAANELQEYLAGKRRRFDVALDLQGSSFQKAVWTEACNVDYGGTATAADIAAAMGKPGSHRSVGTALRQNRLAPFVPTHRIVSANATGREAKIFRGLAAMEQRASK